MDEPDTRFEQQIQRIHELLERFEAEVIWDARVPDPDQPTRTEGRQVDVTIRRGHHLTHIECRLRRKRQDVMWIEELIGRRVSLGADAIIAVSSSGFTSGAIAKAERHGIVTRDLMSLTDDEVAAWGRSVRLTLYFYQYSDVEIALLFGKDSASKLELESEREALVAELKRHPALHSMFNAAAESLGPRLRPSPECLGAIVEFDLSPPLEGLRLCGEPLLAVEFSGNAHLVAETVDAPVVAAYGAPGESASGREAIIERHRLGETSIVHDGDRISTQIDLSSLKVPPLRQLRYFDVRGAQEIDHEVLALIGPEKLRIQGGAIGVTIAVLRDESASGLAER